jgi:hypothetical protein
MFALLSGAIIIIISWVLEPFVALVQKRLKRNSYARLEWAVNNAMQLQRLAHEELGLGHWSRGAESIPMTDADVELGVLDLTDEKHPSLRRPSVPSPPTSEINEANGDGCTVMIVEMECVEEDYILETARNVSTDDGRISLDNHGKPRNRQVKNEHSEPMVSP